MKRKDYMKPTMQVVKLRQTGMLMQSTRGIRDSYSNGNADVDQSEKDDQGVWEWK
ncbi:MAG: hypothetical protein J5658_02705 [Prevotella sp.]|nr:hypothetical protein [Prevotella sp.]